MLNILMSFIRKVIHSNEFRKKFSLKLHQALNKTNGEPNETVFKIAVNLEKAIFNYAIQEATTKKIVKKWENHSFVQLYIDKGRSTFLNLKNQNYLDKIIQEEITPHEAVFMTHQEINTERWNDLIEKKRMIDENKYNFKMEASTDMFKCVRPSCGSRKCTFYEMQCRSADEPMTIFITCLDCGKKWKR